MVYNYFVCFFVLVLMKLVRMDPVEIYFKIDIVKTKISNNTFVCNHSYEDAHTNKYTVLEDEPFKIIVTYKKFINQFTCKSNNTEVIPIDMTNEDRGETRKLIYNARKEMGTLWNCKVLSHRGANSIFHPLITADGFNFTVAHCFMTIHVRRKESPQTILVNDMVVTAERTQDLSKDVDLIADYEYEEGDVVHASCVNLTYKSSPEMQLELIYENIRFTSSKGVGFKATLHKETSMMCIASDSNDYTKVLIQFKRALKPTGVIMVQYNGMTLRPKPPNKNKYREIKICKYITNSINSVVCEVNEARKKILLFYDDLKNATNNFTKDEIPGKKTTIKFHLQNNAKLRCSADDEDRKAIAEAIDICFTNFDSMKDEFPLDLNFSSNGTVFELYQYYDLRTIYYEFEIGEVLTLTCKPKFQFRTLIGRPLVYLQFTDSDVYNKRGDAIKLTLNLTSDFENFTTACYLKQQRDEQFISDNDKVLREIRVIFQKRVIIIPTTESASNDTSTWPRHPDAITGEESMWIYLWPAVGVVLGVLIICVSIIIFKQRKRNQAQRGPYDRNYENLATPSETSIPPYPSQWEANHYAVPADQRRDDITYSEPYRPEGAVYSIPVPKSRRNKKPEQPVYAVLGLENNQGTKNNFKETDDPNYSEIYSHRPEQCYGKVVPKSLRKVKQDGQYANVAEPTYSEPNIAGKPRGHQYSNINSSRYANNPSQEYVEPTYCEPSKNKK